MLLFNYINTLLFFSLHHTGLTDRLSKLGNPEDEAKRHYKHALEACQKSSIEV